MPAPSDKHQRAARELRRSPGTGGWIIDGHADREAWGTMDTVRGRTLGARYRVDELIGRGGMATVWRGRDLHLDRPVAIKLLERANLTDPTALERFDREARTVARLAHPNVVGIYDFGTDGDDQYLIIELLEGRSLAEMLAAGPLPVEQAVAIAAQVCDGLAATHAAGVVHRDIKPGNLMITPAGVVKILDFGIARLHAAAQSTLTAPATVIGTSQYMAPEQGADDAVDGRTDLYALGCVLYAMLTGAPPFTGESPMIIISQHLHQPPAPLRVRRPDVPAELDELVGQLLAKKPADRPADADRVRARLAAISGVAVGDYRAAAGYPEPAGDQGRGPGHPGAAVRGSAPVVSPTLTMPAPIDPPASHRPPRRGWLAPVGVSVAVIAVLLLVAAFALLNWGSGAPTGQQPAAPPATSADTRPSTPADYQAAIQAVQQRIQAAQLSRNTARDLEKKLQEIERELHKGDAEAAAKKVAELDKKLSELHAEGKITNAAYESIAASVDQLAGIVSESE